MTRGYASGMKKIMTAFLAMAFLTGTVGIVFAQEPAQTDQPKAEKTKKKKAGKKKAAKKKAEEPKAQ